MPVFSSLKGLRIRDVLGDVDELGPVMDIPVRVVKSEKEAWPHYNPKEKEVVVPEWTITSPHGMETLREEAYHALQDHRGDFQDPEKWDPFDLGQINVTPEVKETYETFTDLLVQAGVDIDSIPSFDQMRFSENVFDDIEQLVFDSGRATDDLDLLNEIESAAYTFDKALSGNYKSPDVVQHESPIEVEAGAWSKKKGSIDPKLLAPVALAGATTTDQAKAVGRVFYNVLQEMALSVPALGGYAWGNPIDEVDDTIEELRRLTSLPDPDPGTELAQKEMMDSLLETYRAYGLDEAVEDITRSEVFKTLKRTYEALPERAKRIVESF